MENDISIGIAFTQPDTLCNSVGDTLGLTPVIERLSIEKQQKITVCTIVPELFYNNPYVARIINYPYPSINILPCRQVPCNIVRYYGKQTNIELPIKIKPKIYLTDNEIEYGKNMLKIFDGSKKIAVSIETGYDSKNLRGAHISSLFNRLREQGHKLIGVGIPNNVQYDYDMSLFNKTTLRQAFSIINECDLFLGIDTGLFHCAAALDVPQVIFFRNNLSSNNKYPDTFYIDSRIKCQGGCLNHIRTCQSLVRCMDSFDLDKYFYLINKCLDVGKNNIEASSHDDDLFKTYDNGIY